MVRCLVAAAIVIGLGSEPARAGFSIAPYLQHRRADSIVVRWQLVSPDSGRVEYGLTPELGEAAGSPGAGTDHEVTLAGLLVDTSYHYRVVAGPDTSDRAVFRAGISPSAGFEFLVAADHQDDSAAHQRVADRMAAAGSPLMLINAGDLTQHATTAGYRSYFNIERALLGRVPVFPAIGNHDAESLPNWHRFLALPGNERWYSVRLGPAAFHALSTEDSLLPGSSQYEWLRGELAADSADPAVRHVFVHCHLPPYTTNTVYGGNADVRQHLGPLFERFGVRIVFSGHVHAYEHSRVNGVHYIITGGGGAALARGWNPPQAWTVYREATYEFLLVSVRGDTIVSRGIRPDGSEFDTLVIAGEPTAIAEAARPMPAPGRPGHVVGAATFGVPAGTAVRVYRADGRLAAVRRAGFDGRVVVDNLVPGVYVVRFGESVGRFVVVR
jgi:predicted phosphodiesterase